MNIAGHNLIFVFDLDNTLVKTNVANNESYKEAIRDIAGIDISLNARKRFTRTELKRSLPDLSDSQISDIVEKKQSVFIKYIEKTILNNNLFSILKALHACGNKTLLLTNCHKERAMKVCEYYGLVSFFNEMFFCEDYPHRNKYKFLIDKDYNLDSIVLFENEKRISSQALEYGIEKQNIIRVNF